jgi:septal ring factor EnvC (AmiA/AmiB activator)
MLTIIGFILIGAVLAYLVYEVRTTKNQLAKTNKTLDDTNLELTNTQKELFSVRKELNQMKELLIGVFNVADWFEGELNIAEKQRIIERTRNEMFEGIAKQIPVEKIGGVYGERKEGRTNLRVVNGKDN